jgi:hypothetical protein
MYHHKVIYSKLSDIYPLGRVGRNNSLEGYKNILYQHQGSHHPAGGANKL